jgi:hypothetical protein
MNDLGHDGADLDRDQRGTDEKRNGGDASILAAGVVAARRPTHDRPPSDW